MKILFVSGLYAEEKKEYLREKAGIYGLQNAANTYQWGILKGIVGNTNDCTVVSFPFVPFAPFRSKIWKTPYSEIRCDGKVVGSMEPYYNIVFWKEFSIKTRLQNYIRRWVTVYQKEGETEFMVIFYSLPVYFINAIVTIKKEIPSLRVCAIVTDMVEDALEAYHHNWWQVIMMKRDKRCVLKAYEAIDKYVLLSERMVDRIPKANHNNVIIEGIFSDEILDATIPIVDKWDKTLLYTGSLMSFTGIMDLISAFMETTDPDFKLIICGVGECEVKIREAVVKDKRIEYKGIVKRETALEYQRKATALINPRRPDSELTKYSFPSKTIEYLASGTPMIGYKLEGIPSEYYKYYYTINNLSKEELKNTITCVLSSSKEELTLKGEAARRFIINNKTALVQGKKLIQYLYQ